MTEAERDTAIVATFLRGTSVSDIATPMGVRNATVERILRRALSGLLTRLGERTPAVETMAAAYADGDALAAHWHEAQARAAQRGADHGRD